MKIDEMVAGYIRGFDRPADDMPDCYSTKSTAWKHGWLNGRDDAHGKPRERAGVLRARADMIIGISDER